MVTKQAYKYYKQVSCAHLINSLKHGTYDVDLNEVDESSGLSGVIDRAMEQGIKLDPALEYFKEIGEKVELEFIKWFNKPNYSSQMEIEVCGQMLRPDMIHIDDENKVMI